ncbi:hypothetical protein VTK73DRAFT_1516 [Phialemonium thermophilum]|uniref:RNA-dependent RNA polymerase n=1 Tax=Phialemonium thermophilum TaxID=223376 RepID=A0ABR3X925_9PEZI
MPAGRPEPHTPKRLGDEAWKYVIAELNQEYNLGIVDVYDRTLTPARRQAISRNDKDFKRHNHICGQIHRLFYNDQDRLDNGLAAFKNDVRDAYRSWVPKPDAEPDTLPLARTYAARTSQEQCQLQELLLARLSSTPPPPHASPATLPTLPQQDSSSPGRTKRVSDGSETDRRSAKRWVLEGESQSAWTSAVDRVPFRQRLGIPLQRSFHSETTEAIGSSSKESVFSLPKDRSFDSQTTFSQDTLSPPSSSQIRALDDSFTSFMNRADKSALFEKKLQLVWPTFPDWLQDAPLAVAWEMTRIAVHCHVDLRDLPGMAYDARWSRPESLDHIWRSLARLPEFQGKSFPGKPAGKAWTAGLTNEFQDGYHSVVLSMSVHPNLAKDGPAFLVRMKPLALDKGCRLHRRFGADRFLEIDIESPSSWPKNLQMEKPAVIHWLTKIRHSILGRQWGAFYVDSGSRKRKHYGGHLFQHEQREVFEDRVHLFAEEGVGLGLSGRPALPVSRMLDWLLNFGGNEEQAFLKLFSRIQLGLSKTSPAMVFEKHQIRDRPSDILSPTGEVMNDGVGQMSLSVARRLRDHLGLSDIPCAVQGRLGSAKGMWIIDVTDNGTSDWIETYPSQRKWHCKADDPAQRTLEVHSIPSEVRSADLNEQFLPILENRARDKRRFREVISNKSVAKLQDVFERLRTCFEEPLELRLWLNEAAPSRQQRVLQGEVPFLGGLPETIEDSLAFLVDGGFHPLKLQYMYDQLWKIMSQKWDSIRDKFKITIGRSAHLKMVADFLGVLEEGEVHIGFSTKFQADEDFSATLLDDIDVLVARSPAHFVSDVQRVRAVFHPKLQALKDVVVFSTRGNVPLASMLSGGDYDGDIAWVCWDPDIVDNFVNAKVPTFPDLSEYVGKNTTTFGELAATCFGTREDAIAEMVQRSFDFNMEKSFLGVCTNFKERICYERNDVNDDVAIVLSTLLSSLVDQAKQGIIFTKDHWARLRTDRLNLRLTEPEQPAYKSKQRSCPGTRRQLTHILDYLKFSVVLPMIDDLNIELSRMKNHPQAELSHWDSDLASYDASFADIIGDRQLARPIRKNLEHDIEILYSEWRNATAASGGYSEKVKSLYHMWRAIEPRMGDGATVPSRIATLMDEKCLGSPDLSRWCLTKASVFFNKFYNKNPSFVWQIAGRQLQYIKATVAGTAGTTTGGPIPISSLMYAALKPDKLFVRQYVANLKDGSSVYFSEGPSSDEETDAYYDDDDDFFEGAHGDL